MKPTTARYFRAVRDVPEYGILAGDSFKFDPRSDLTFTVVRHVPVGDGTTLLTSNAFEPFDASEKAPLPFSRHLLTVLK